MIKNLPPVAIEMMKGFRVLGKTQWTLLVEGIGEAQGLINAGRIEDAMQHLQTLKDLLTYPDTIGPAKYFTGIVGTFR